MALIHWRRLARRAFAALARHISISGIDGKYGRFGGRPALFCRRRFPDASWAAEVQELEPRTLLSAAAFKTIDFPGATDTRVYGISGSNVVGSASDGGLGFSGFVYNGSTFTTLSVPGGFETYPFGISGSNIVGSYSSQQNGLATHGFVYNGSIFTILDVPGAAGTMPLGISGSAVVGNYFDALGGNPHGFLYNGSTFTNLDVPGAADTEASGISGNTVVGDYIDSSSGKMHGFLYNGSIFTSLDVPGAAGTCASGISGNTVVGTYSDSSSGNPHGFLYDGSTFRTLPDDPIGPPGATSYQGISGSTLVGQYHDSSNLFHGFEYTFGQISIDETTVDPAAAVDLPLNHVWGGENVKVPITVSNPEGIAVNGTIRIDLYLSTTPNLDKSPTFLLEKAFSNVVATPPPNDIFDVAVAIPSSLQPGAKYYFVAQVSATGHPSDNDNLAATQDPFEFVSTRPHHALTINLDKTYFDIVRDTVAKTDPFVLAGAPDPADGQHFTAAFESPGGYDNPNLKPYLDTAKHPTIGIGINLDSISGIVMKTLVGDVKANRSGWKNLSAVAVINRLKLEAHQKNAPASLTISQAQQLFILAYKQAESAARSFVGVNVWKNNLSRTAQWALTDLAFNAGGNGGLTGFTQLRQALSKGSPDYLRAGFEVLDSLRSAQQVQYARSLADYEYMVRGSDVVF
jgi:hypothetical protein